MLNSIPCSPFARIFVSSPLNMSPLTPSFLMIVDTASGYDTLVGDDCL